jgi:hypothetical protein
LAKHKSSFKESIPDDIIDELFDNTSPNANMVTAIQSAVESAVSVGANTLIDQLDIDTVFSLENPRAVDYLDEYAAQLVAGIDEYSKQLLRDLLTNATEQGFSYQKTAKLIEKMFTGWSTNRAKLIATTEVGNAYQEGNLIVGKDLAASGVAIEKSWLTRGDDKVDPHCSANADQGWIDVNTVFSSGVERPLDHPRCRCVMLMRRKPDETKAVVKSSTKIDFAKPATYKTINNALDGVGVPSSIWNGKIKFVTMQANGVFLAEYGYIAMNKDRVNSTDTAVKDKTFKTIVHELLHTRSMGLDDLKLGVGWEEGIVEGLAQLLAVDVADSVGYTYRSADDFKQSYKDHPYRKKWVNPIETVFDTLGLDYTVTYKTLLNKSIKNRKQFIKDALIEKLGVAAGTQQFEELNKVLA